MGEPLNELSQLTASLSAAGLDLVAAGSLRRYNLSVEPSFRLPSHGREDAMVVVVGNSRALWPAFIAALRERPSRLAAPHPLDEWVSERVEAAARALPCLLEVRLAHEAPPRRVAMQQLAETCGLAWRSPAHLSVHPRFGPWIGLRAALVLDLEPSPETSAAPRPCFACEDACSLAVARALRSGGGDWRQWLAARDACPHGREHRYGEEQIRYHYTKDREALAALVMTKDAKER